MRDYEKALSDIADIRSKVAASTTFRGLGPAALGLSGLMALLTAICQSLFLTDPLDVPFLFFSAWIVVAAISGVLIGAEMIVRSRQEHGGLADSMILNAVHQFLPAGAAGTALGAILWRFAPDHVWMLPGLWSILVSLGLFAAVPSLPRTVAVAAAWYFVAGCAVLMWAASGPALSPWMMGLPFAVGQLLLAAIIYKTSGDLDDA
ncbi:hypothetical protein V6C03_13440 [Methyloligella sp. 2.7D]|uniref:hypothetical protein n=1 Tax=unclassified Methyloligella TaxID=2625955 RepID=UPI00157CFC85|nr:hypothetical protein [Methyloligella sp. GL2]QKP77227.1 hypothetical protein HT051_07025 [Methyloligella sp. GL2]